MYRRWISPKTWTPPAAQPNEGRTSRTKKLEIERRIPTGSFGPEDVIFDKQGRAIVGCEGGNIIAINVNTGATQVLGNTGGRPLGLHDSADGSLLIADAENGVLRLHSNGKIDVIVDSIKGKKLTFASNVTQTSDGTIFSTVSTTQWDLANNMGDIFEHTSSGLLVRIDKNNQPTILLDDLKFANGVVASPDDTHLIFAETCGYRISRYWLKGPKTGTVEPMLTNLPGFPDNISVGSDGLLYVGMANPRKALLDALLPLPGFIRTFIWNLPDFLKPKEVPYAFLMAFDFDGNIVYDLRNGDGSYKFVTAAAEKNGVIVIASLHEDAVAIVKNPPKESPKL